MNKKIIFWGD